ncbi:MAG TPA: SH3 domain-containing protein, partial [Hyphomicrobiales bacterium]
PAPAPAIEIAPPPVPETKSEIVLSTPGRIEAQTGDEVDFAIAIDSDETLPARSVIAIRAMPAGASFSQGRPYGTTEWNLRPDEVGDLRLRVPKIASGSSDLRVELMAADGTILASATTRLDIASDPRSALILRADESNRVANLIAHGHKMIDVGYFAGARAYFKRAAEAGSGDAALLLGATFDPEFIDKIGAHGIKADPQEARGWYDRAKQLGVEDAETKLRALKDGTAEHHPVQATEAQPAAAPPVPVAAEPEPAAPTVPAAPAEAQIAADDSEAGDATQSPTETAADKDQWVALLSYANVRAAPSSTADTLRVAEKGAKLRLTGRKGNWVQVTDPATAEVGWVYSRYIELAEAPAQ